MPTLDEGPSRTSAQGGFMGGMMESSQKDTMNFDRMNAQAADREQAITDIQKLLYGKANLAEILVKIKQVQSLIPKFMSMKKDLEY
mmetsp:Transcript_34699/g.53213  ORF Transcript_34699/g.53213 Transcript_34699/m.53213 type:complete len:86 (+) Transcript_34699:79-336(+)